MPKLLSSKQITAILTAHGFVQVSQRGSQVKFRNQSRIVIVPSPRKEIPSGTLRSIIRQSGLTTEDFEV